MSRTARSVGMVSASAFVTFIIMLVRGFWIPRMLAPEVYGIWGVFTIVMLFAFNLHGGLSHAMNREVSTARGANDVDVARKIRNTTMTWMAVLSIAALVVTLGIALAMDIRGADIRFVVCLALVALIMPLQQANVYLLTVLRTEHKFGVISSSEVIAAIVGLVTVIGLLPWLQLYAVPLGLLTRYAASNIIVLTQLEERPRLLWDVPEGLRLFRIGLPLLGITLLAAAFRSADRFVILRLLDVEALGYYGVAFSFFELAVAIPQATGSVLNPQFNELYGQTQDPTSMREPLRQSVGTLCLVLALITGLGCVTLEFPIRLILPDYVQAIPVAKALVIGGYFWGVAEVAHYFFIAIQRQQVVLRLQVWSVVINVVASAVCVMQGMGLLGVAVGTLIAYAYYGCAAMYLALKVAGDTPALALRHSLAIAWPLGMALLGLTVVRYWLAPAMADSLSLDFFVDAGRRCLIVLVCCAPALWQLGRRMRELRSGARV